MGDGELSLAFTFNPLEPAAAVADYQLPPTTRSYVLDNGTLGNVHFVASPFNASHKAGALVLANFLLSPEAQARKQDIEVWGDATVLAYGALQWDDAAGVELCEALRYAHAHGGLTKVKELQLAGNKLDDGFVTSFVALLDGGGLAGVETLVFDIQDVGARFYTYIWTMYTAMRAAARTRAKFVVLDRPNPVGGRARGPMRRSDRSRC